MTLEDSALAKEDPAETEVIDSLLEAGDRALVGGDEASQSGRLDDAASLYQGAVQAFAKVLDQQPDLVAALVSRGYALLQLGHRGPALHDFKKAVDMAPDAAFARLALGQYYESLGQYEAADEHYAAAAELEPKDPTPQLLLARSSLAQGDLERAAASATRAIECDASKADGIHRPRASQGDRRQAGRSAR